MKETKRRIDLDEIERFMIRIREKLEPDDQIFLTLMLETFIRLVKEIESKTASLKRLRNLIFGSTEKRPKSNDTSNPTSSTPPTDPPKVSLEKKKKRPGHGRIGSEQYTGATQVDVPHPNLKPGDPCPECGEGKLSQRKEPATLIFLEAGAPIQATQFNLEKLRCNRCDAHFTAPAPGLANEGKYDPSVGAMIALMHYGGGMPFNRLETLQNDFGIPLPASMQWEACLNLAPVAKVCLETLRRMAANSPLFYNDDTSGKIRTLTPSNRLANPDIPEGRTGTHISVIMAQIDGRDVALYFSGWKHAGENLGDILNLRDPDLPPPIQMCDPLSRNWSHEFEVQLANCLAHLRREFIPLEDLYPMESKVVIESLGTVYLNEKETKSMSALQRLEYHQLHSKPIMDNLKTRVEVWIDKRDIEPNSELGKACKYLLRHWDAFTLFLREPGVPLDNNFCEQSIKTVVLLRKNSYHYKTERGAEVGDCFMSLIHTCRLNQIDAYPYLLFLARNSKDFIKNPELFLPWNYTQNAVNPILN